MPSPFYPATFLEPVTERDDDGQIIQSYREAFEDRVSIRFLRGGETVMASRLESKSPAIIKIRNSERARSVTSEWRVSANGRVYEMKEDPRPVEDRRWLEGLAEARA